MEAASKPRRIRDRILLIGSERNLPKKDVKRALKASHGRGDYLIDFAKTHRISLDWLLLGDLRGLMMMKRWLA